VCSSTTLHQTQTNGQVTIHTQTDEQTDTHTARHHPPHRTKKTYTKNMTTVEELIGCAHQVVDVHTMAVLTHLDRNHLGQALFAQLGLQSARGQVLAVASPVVNVVLQGLPSGGGVRLRCSIAAFVCSPRALAQPAEFVMTLLACYLHHRRRRRRRRKRRRRSSNTISGVPWWRVSVR
jgi:hypothetical protein